jgi:hypothetical protein
LFDFVGSEGRAAGKGAIADCVQREAVFPDHPEVWPPREEKDVLIMGGCPAEFSPEISSDAPDTDNPDIFNHLIALLIDMSH